MADTISGIVKNHIDTASNLATWDGIPYLGEITFESDSLKGKVGDGTTSYNSLAYSFDILSIATKPTGTTDQIAKAWVNFNGTGTVAIRDSFNVSSITDNGTGDYTINFTSPMNDANYSCNIGVRHALSTASRGGSSFGVKNGTTPSINSVNIATYINSSDIDAGAIWDHDWVNVTIFGS